MTHSIPQSAFPIPQSPPVTVFLGPSLDWATAQSVLAADYRPPAALGDVLHALASQPRAILLIDGLFERQPAVWHKEILWAMHHGVPVWGAASMGALRAAELAPLGMVGVGQIFAWFHEGVLEADDEVAVRHLPAAWGWRPTTEALVNMRATLAHAQAQGVIGADTAADLLGRARALHYSQRTYERLLAGLRERYGQMRGRVLPPLPHLAAEMGFGRPDLFLLELMKWVG